MLLEIFFENGRWIDKHPLSSAVDEAMSY